MKKVLTAFAIVFSAATFSNISAQQAAPPGAGDKNLGDNNVKTRSIELERVDREAHKTGSSAVNSNASAEDRLAVKYGEIKEDFEQIQMSQDIIIKSYQGSGKIDYAKMSESAKAMNKSSKRLESNLFPSAADENADAEKEGKSEKNAAQESKQTKSIRDLIVDLDASISSFATSSMFQNLRLIDPKVAIKTKMDLQKIIELSAELNAEAEKSAAGN